MNASTTRSLFYFSALLSVAAGLSLLLAGCDLAGVNDTSSTSGLIEARSVTNLTTADLTDELLWRDTYFATASALLTVEEDGLHMLGSDEARLYVGDGPMKQADLFFAPAPIANDQPFSIELTGRDLEGEEVVLSEITHREEEGGGYALSMVIQYLQPSKLALECRMRENLVFSETIRPAEGQDMIMAGTTDEEPTSYHYEEQEDGSTEVFVDYEDDEGEDFAQQTTTLTLASGETVECSHLGFVLHDVQREYDVAEGIVMSGVQELFLYRAEIY